MRRTMLALVLAALLIGCSTPAMAEDGYNAQLFWPSIFGGNFIAIEDSHTLCPMGFGGGLLINYANRPVELRIDEEPEAGILNQLLTADILAAFGPVSFISIGVDVPFHLYARGRTFEDLAEGTGMSGLENEISLGDIRAEIKFRILQQEKHWIGLAAAPYGTFPTGDETRFLGEGRVTGGGTVMLEHDFRVLNVGLNGGYLYRGDADLSRVNVGDAWKLGAGISREWDFGLSFSVEYWSSWFDSGSVDRFQANPMEVMGTVRYRFGSRGPRVIGGGGAGGTSGVGCPAYRLLAGVDYYYCRPEATEGTLRVRVIDENGDKIESGLRIKGPLEMDTNTNSRGHWKQKVEPGQYEVTAFKPGYSSDTGEGIVELSTTTEITLVIKKIPTSLTIIVIDKYTGERLDSKVIFDQGTDNELVWMLPEGEKTEEWKPGSHKLIASSPGYETKFTSCTVIENQENVVKIELRHIIVKIGRIYFDFDSDVIRKNSYPVLDDVAKQILALPKFKRIIIEGHCSSEGTDEYNMDLSTRRAQAVKNYLVKKGIDAAVLQIEPYGESRPIATNENEEGRAQNRRVEFIIEEE